MSEEVFNQEIGLIRTRQRWLAEQRDRLEQQLADIQRYSFDPQSIEMLRQRLEARLATETLDDRRFILEAVGTKVMVQADGTWELELQVPREVPALEGGLHIVNARPGMDYINPSSWKQPYEDGRLSQQVACPSQL